MHAGAAVPESLHQQYGGERLLHGLTGRRLLAAQHHGVLHGRRRRCTLRDTASRARGRLADFSSAARPQRQNLPPLLHAREAAVLLHIADHYGHPEQPVTNAHSLRDLSVHHGFVSILQTESTALAEFYSTFAVFQRLFCQSTTNA